MTKERLNQPILSSALLKMSCHLHFKLVVGVPNYGRKIAQLINIHQVREDKEFSDIMLSCQVIKNPMNEKHVSLVTKHA